jgi:cytochrome c-type biogenesis protein CcmH/NrfF
MYKLKCNTCNNSYVGQSGRSIEQDIKNTHGT